LPRPAIGVAAGEGHTCALLDDNSVSCWGANSRGQLGNGGAPSLVLSPPAAITLEGPAIGVFAGRNTSCATVRIGNDGQGFTCWGSDAFGALGDGGDRDGFIATPSPLITLASGAQPVFSSIGAFVHCVTTSTQAGNCWGNSEFGQFGQGAIGEPFWNNPLPTDFQGPGGADISEIKVGRSHVCALLVDGRIACWGTDDLGQRGDGASDSGPTVVPTLVSLPNDALATSFDVGRGHACAALDDGRVSCWGDDFLGQNGDGDFALSGDINGSPTAPFRAALAPLRPRPPMTLAQVDLRLQVKKVLPAPPTGQLRYEITLGNVGLDDALDASLAVSLSDDLIPQSWSCQTTNGAICALGDVATLSGSVDLPVDATVQILLDVSVDAGAVAVRSVAASVSTDISFSKELEASDNDDVSSDATEDDDSDGVNNNVDVCDSTPDSEIGEIDDTGCGPSERDTDGDGASDALDAFPNDPTETADTDGDGLGENREATLGTNPSLADSDGDGFDDGEEVDAGSNPLLAADVPATSGLNTILIKAAIDARDRD
jgi:hypothetical protein